ncbi:MAG: hypothetical protein ACAI25_09520, partial [Planctomycetota bacterium]
RDRFALLRLPPRRRKTEPLFADGEALVERSFLRPLERPPVARLETEADWDAHQQDMLRKVARLGRAIDERLERGLPHADAYQQAMLAEGVGLSDAFEQEPEPDGGGVGLLEEDEDEGELREVDRDHPVVVTARKLVEDVLRFFDPSDRNGHGDEADPLGPTTRGMLEVLGGTVQALAPALVIGSVGLEVVQLKRALRGAAHAFGGLRYAVGEGLLDACPALDIEAELGRIVVDLEKELAAARARMPAR